MSLITFEDKVNNPELEAMFQGMPANTYLSAQDINEIKSAIETLDENQEPVDISNKLERGGYSGTAQDLADASFKKNIFFTTSLADLGLTSFDELTNEIVADWISSLEIIENDNEIYYYEILEGGIFDETFDETFE